MDARPRPLLHPQARPVVGIEVGEQPPVPAGERDDVRSFHASDFTAAGCNSRGIRSVPRGSRRRRDNVSKVCPGCDPRGPAGPLDPSRAEGALILHIPSAKSLPFDTLVTDDNLMKSPAETAKMMEAAGIKPATPS